MLASIDTQIMSSLISRTDVVEACDGCSAFTKHKVPDPSIYTSRLIDFMGGSRNIPIQVLLSDLKIKFLNSRFRSQSCSRDEGHAVWHGSPGRNSIAQPFPKLGSLGDVAGLMDGIAV